MSRAIIEVTVDMDDDCTNGDLDEIVATITEAIRGLGHTPFATAAGWMLELHDGPPPEDYVREHDPYDGEHSAVRYGSNLFGDLT